MQIGNPDFPLRVQRTLMERAGHECANPDCRKRTTAPHTDDMRVVRIGEASHIAGARPGSARHDPKMSDEERGCITNGIWLCRDCAAIIDRDEARFPAENLRRWKREQEQRSLKTFGKPLARPTKAKEVDLVEAIGLHEIKKTAHSFWRPTSWDETRGSLVALSLYTADGTDRQKREALDALAHMAVYTRSEMPRDIALSLLDRCHEATPGGAIAPARLFDECLVKAADVVGHVGYDTVLYLQRPFVAHRVAADLSRLLRIAKNHKRERARRTILEEFRSCIDAARRARTPWEDAAACFEYLRDHPDHGHEVPRGLSSVEARLLEVDKDPQRLNAQPS